MGHGKVDAILPEDYDAGQRHYGWPITMVYQLVSRDKKHTIYEHPEAYANDAAPFSFDDAAPVNVNDKKSQVRTTYRKIDRQGMLKTYTHPTKEQRERLNIHSDYSLTKMYAQKRKTWVHEIYKEQYKAPCKGSKVFHGYVFDKSNGGAEDSTWVKVVFVKDGEILICMLPQEVRHKWWFWGHVGKDGGTFEGVRERTFEELKEWKEKRAAEKHAAWKAEQTKNQKAPKPKNKNKSPLGKRIPRKPRKGAQGAQDALGRTRAR